MRTIPVIVAALAFASCGSPPPDVPPDPVGTYVMGDATKARDAVERASKPSPEGEMTLGDLLKESEKKPITLSGSVDIVLTLRADGTFTYLGPLKMGDDAAEVLGRWSVEGASVMLALDAPRVSGKETVSRVVAPFKPGVVQYPMGRDERVPVYYRLVSTAATAGTKGGIQVGGG
jgi:hypothetical protein